MGTGLQNDEGEGEEVECGEGGEDAGAERAAVAKGEDGEGVGVVETLFSFSIFESL